MGVGAFERLEACFSKREATEINPSCIQSETLENCHHIDRTIGGADAHVRLSGHGQPYSITLSALPAEW
jgi:hypothetical protein